MDTKETELSLLRDRADLLGISYHPSIGVDKLKEKLAGVGITSVVDLIPVTGETEAQRNVRLRKEANTLVRINLTCMNPAKKDWPGDTFSVGNSAIGWIKRFIPFAAEDGWYIPKAIIEVMKDKKYVQFYNVRVDGKKVKKSRQVKEFAIEILPDLTITELTTLAAKQAREENMED